MILTKHVTVWVGGDVLALRVARDLVDDLTVARILEGPSELEPQPLGAR